MISALIVATLLGAGPASPAPSVGELVNEVKRAFLEDGVDRVSATATHRVISHADGSLELQGTQPLTLALESISRASTCRTTMRARAAVFDAPQTVRSLKSCDVEESWTNSAVGLEHAFTILRAPPGVGGFTLFVRVEGPWHHADEHGHVFQGPGAAHALRYGRAFVVRGAQRTPIDVVHVEGGLELRVPAALADAPGAFPMEIDPVLSSEIALDPLISDGPSPGLDETPAIAVNELGTALVVWADNRRSLGIDLFAARILSDGTLGDPVGFPITVAQGHQVRPTVCAEGADFLVAWETPVDGGIQIRGARVNSDGAPGAEFFITNGSEPALAAAGDSGIDFLAYVDLAKKVQVIPILRTMIGGPVNRPVIPDEFASRPAIAASNDNWFAAWEVTTGSLTSIRGMSNSNVGSPTIVTVFDNAATVPARRPTVALVRVGSQTEDAIIFWDQGVNTPGMRMSTLTGPTPFTFQGSSPALVRTSSALQALPTLGSFINGINGPQLQLRDLNDGGVTSLTVGARPADLVLAGGPPIVAAWTESPRFESDVYGATFGSASPAQRFLVSRAANSQRGPRVAFVDGTREGLAVWIDGTTTIYGARVTEDVYGLRLGARFVVHRASETLQQVELAAIATADTTVTPTFLVTWRQSGPVGIMAQLTSSAMPVGPALSLATLAAPAGPAVAWDLGTGLFQVAFSQGDEVVTRSVGTDGIVGAITSRAAGEANELAISCVRSSCLLAWETDSRELRGYVLGAATPGPPFSVPAPARRPVVAHDGTDYYLAYHSAGGVSLAKLVAGAPVSLGPVISPSNTAGVTSISLASAIPPVLVWSEVTNLGLATVYLQRADPQSVKETLGTGFNAAVATTSVTAEPTGALVFQRYLASELNTMRVYGRAFSYLPDAGYLDGGFDAGFDGGVDAGSSDAGADGGPEPDAGEDAGEMMESDAGVDDGGFSSDGGVLVFETSGCGCQSSAGFPLALLLAVLLGRRRRMS